MDTNSNFLPKVNYLTTTTAKDLLPEPIQFAKDSYDMAFPQIIAFTAAISGIFAVILILRAISKS